MSRTTASACTLEEIEEKSKLKHLYLPGRHHGVFNRKASQAFDEIILTEMHHRCPEPHLPGP